MPPHIFRIKKKLLILNLTLFLNVLGSVIPAYAEEYQSNIPHYNIPSSSLMGMAGLNLIPSSRMDEKGTVRLGVSIADPYLFVFMGVQIAEPLYLNLRQTYEVSSLNNSAKNLYPAIDFKLRLIKEDSRQPEISLGMNSALGHKRTASEYLAFSKRHGNLDFTGGLAWGRMAGKGHIKNPLRVFSSHFSNNRNFNSTDPQKPNDWFTGEEIGFFGGVEYFTPIKGLSLKADYGAYNYTPEKTTNVGFSPPSPWSFGFNYKPWKPLDLSIATIGGEKIMGRLSIQGDLKNWRGKSSKKQEPPAYIYPRENNNGDFKKTLNLNSFQSTGQQIGRAARLVANQSPSDNENIEISLKHKGLKGPKIQLIRHDLEEAIIYHQGSPEEIWQDVNFLPHQSSDFSLKDFFSLNSLKNDIRIILDNKIGLSEVDTGILYKTSAILEIEKSLPFGLRLGTSPKINIANNFGNIRSFRLPELNPVKSDEDYFSTQRITMNRLYASWLYSVNKDLHASLSAGFLEEMYAGYGGEILYRPFKKRYAVGLEGWQAIKREPNSSLAMELKNQENFTGHLNMFYELPNKTTTLFAKVGKYLAQDFGGTFGIKNQFDNGTTLEGFITTTNKSDYDIFGGRTNFYGGIKLTMPIGNIPLIPEGSEIRLTAAPIARDSGQTLDAPNKLYDVTEPISYRQLSQTWRDLLD